MKTASKGFTLIELLVVISIIGALASVVLASLATAQGKARGAKIHQEIKQLTNALYLARLDDPAGKFPGANIGGNNWRCLKASGTCFYGNYNADPAITVALAPYISTIPTPPNPPFDVSTPVYSSWYYVPDVGTGVTFCGGVVGCQSAMDHGAYLLWGQEGPIPTGQCPGYYYGKYDPTVELYYCYEFIGTNQ